MATEIYYIEMLTYNYAWKGAKKDYDGTGNELGVKTAKPGTKGLVFGATVKPTRVRINVDAGNGKSKSYTRFADPDKIESLIVNETLTGSKYDSKTITSVRVASGGA